MTDPKLTRCPGCATVFRVTAAQLDLREGQVRCGHCRAVFDANDHFVSLEASPPPDEFEPQDELMMGRPTVTLRSADALLPVARDEPIADEVTSDDTGAALGEVPAEGGRNADDDGIAPRETTEEGAAGEGAAGEGAAGQGATEEGAAGEGAAGEGAAGQGATGEGATGQGATGEGATGQGATGDGAAGEDVAAQSLAPVEQRADAGAEADVAADADAEPRSQAADAAIGGPAPRFEWKKRKPAHAPRRLYAVAAIVLALGLVLQVVLEYRDALAAHVPATRPLIIAACRPLGCSINPLRDAAALSIDASDLQADPAHRGLLLLSATVRNRAGHAIAFPYLELTLTDSSDRVVARRAFAPADYASGTADLNQGIGANGEHIVRLFIDASATQQAGYRLYLFYP